MLRGDRKYVLVALKMAKFNKTRLNMKNIGRLALVIFILFFALEGEIKYKISGQVICKGHGVEKSHIDAIKLVDGEIYAVDEVVTDGRGIFSLYLEPGNYSLVLTPSPGFVADPASRKQRVCVGDSNVGNVVFEVFTECAISGSAKLGNGTPLKGYVEAKNKNAGSESVSIDRNGNYKIRKLYPGVWNITFELDAFRDVEGIEVFLEDAEHKTGVNVTIPTATLALQGVILDRETKIAVPGRLIRILFTNERGEFENKMLTSDDDGMFYYNNIPPGKIYIIYNKGREFDEPEDSIIELTYDGERPAKFEIEY